jgi:hypothetical protein
MRSTKPPGEGNKNVRAMKSPESRLKIRLSTFVSGKDAKRRSARFILINMLIKVGVPILQKLLFHGGKTTVGI